MLRQLLHNLLHPAARTWPGSSPRRNPARADSAQFIAYLAESGTRQVNATRYESSLRHRRAIRTVLVWVFAAGFAWIALESAQALSMF